MPSTYTSNWMEVDSGSSTNYQVPDSHNITGAEVRFRGITVESTEEKTRYNKNRYDGPLEYYADEPSETADISVGTPEYPSDAEDLWARLDLRDNVNGSATIEYSTTNSSGEFNSSGEDIVEGVRLYDYNQYAEVIVSPNPYDDNSDGSTGHNASAEIRLDYEVSSTDRSDPQTTLGEGTVDFPTLDDGETTSWSSIDGLSTGANEFSHTIGGSATADFQFRYTYTENASVPIGVSAGTLGATITDETVTAGRVPAGATTLDSLPDFSDQSGWLARLTTLGGTTETFGAERLKGVGINPEHTAAWGGTIDLPPIIDPDDYRGGSMELRYDGALILRCPTLIDRDEADDGTITIKGVGPASELKASPVDRDFRSVLATDAMETLLVDDADVPGPQVTIHDPPDRPVIDEIVQSATTREEFAQFLSGRSRDSSSGQFAAGSGTADGWPDTAPFEWAGAGDIAVTKTLRFTEAENGALGSGVSPSAASGASGGSVVRFAAAGDAATYAASFKHVIPEGSFGVAIRAEPESTGDAGTTTFRARVDDEELLSAPASDFGAAGTGFSWVRTTVDFQPGTEAFDVALDLTQSGALQLDVDAVAFYDDRFSYFFDNSTDANDALKGPQYYPRTAALEFEPAPAGIVLDSATATATVDAAGAASTIGLRAPDGTGSTSSIVGTTDSHTASFSGTVSGVRPIVELSRYADGRTETPTTGNAGQTLQSIQTTISGNAIPVIEERSFAETTVFDAVQTLCNDYAFNWAVEHGNERGTFRIEIFKRGDPALRRQLPAETVVMDASESAAAENYKNEVTVVGARIPNGGGERYRWTESAAGEIDEFGREPLPLENDDLESTNDCRVVARAALAKRLDEDDRGGKLSIVPQTIVEPGYPYAVEQFSEGDAMGWGEGAWGEFAWGSPQAFATAETATFSASAGDVSAAIDFDDRAEILDAFTGAF